MLTVSDRKKAYLQRVREAFRRRRKWHKAYLWVRLAPGAILRQRKEMARYSSDWRKELETVKGIPGTGVYELSLPLTNDAQPHAGKNFLGYPAAGGLQLAGRPIGWFAKPTVAFGGELFRAYQLETDLEYNLPMIFDRYRPEVVVDFGTASGATAVLSYSLMRSYIEEPRVLSVDLNDVLDGPFGASHIQARTQETIEFHVGNALGSQTVDKVRDLVAGNSKSVLLSFDDDHFSQHVFDELSTYGPFLKTGDVILVQDTWDQGLRNQAFSPLLAVLRFLDQTQDFDLDLEALRALRLPCSFVHGLLIRA